MVNTSELTCFNCERKGHVSKDCTFDTIEDGSPLNTRQEKKKFMMILQGRDVSVKDQIVKVVMTHDVISFTIDLLRARGDQFTPVADAMAEGREITYGSF